MKIAFLTNILTPYRIALYKELAKKSDLTVYVCAKTEKDRKWELELENINFKVVLLKGPSFTFFKNGEISKIIHLKLSIIYYIFFKKYDKFIIGDASWTSFLAAGFMYILKKKYCWWNEIISLSNVSRKGIKHKLRRFLISRAETVYVSGSKSKEYIKELGIEDNKIIISYNTVDTNLWQKLYNKYKNLKNDIRKSLDFDENDKILIFVGQLIDRKNIIGMLNMLAQLIQLDKSYKLILVGDGPKKEDYVVMTQNMKLEKHVFFYPFVKSEEELAKYYVMSDALVLLSHEEPWGMVVNEASIFGLKLILSKNIGAAYDFENKILYDKNIIDVHHYICQELSVNFNDIKRIDESAEKFLL